MLAGWGDGLICLVINKHHLAALKVGADHMQRPVRNVCVCEYEPKTGSSACAPGTAATAQGRAVLSGWGYSAEEVAEAQEQLQALASAAEVDDEFY